ncbi:LOW QUALITY PROTEIN: protein meiotic P26-like [Tachypleus tridentatus]|uniref:LOW QUALITY PROTEIN: protein meiotic P26-like n=1 Tax=Tachypleus tridentatus TaxID=6853 RepID=UPI003FD38755
MASNELSPLQSSPEPENDHFCNLCNQELKQPRVLSCLHVFCETCLEKELLDSRNKQLDLEPCDTLDILTCPECKQESKLYSKGISGLPLDFVTSNQLDISAIENTQIICTSCKAKEKAVARCSDCATFLCSNCVTAHQYMRCFENHKVVSFEEMKTSGDGIILHKPVECLNHVGETMKFYCHTCEVPICNECMVADHKQPQHRYERAVDAEAKHRENIENLIKESEEKVRFCEMASLALQNSLTDLQLQRDNAKNSIQETFKKYQEILNKKQETLLQDLEAIHSEKELLVMDTMHSVEKTMEKIEDACKFSKKLITYANAIEILSMKQVVCTQLMYLINNTPKPDVSVEIKFECDESKFEKNIEELCGSLCTSAAVMSKPEDNPPHQQNSPIHSVSSLDNEGFVLPHGVLSDKTSVPSALDVDLGNNVAQYNLAQLAGMAEHSSSHESLNPTPSPPTLYDLLQISTSGPDSVAAAQMNALNNLSALAKLGSVSMNNSGQVLLGRQMISSMGPDSPSMSHTTTSQPHSQGLRSLQPSPLDTDLGSLLNGGTSPLPLQSTRGSSPHFGSPLVNGVSVINANLNLGVPGNIMPPVTGGQGSYNPPPRSATTKLNTMQIRCKFGQLGPGRGQFSSPHGFCLGLEEEIIVADTNNHRIQVFDKMGEFKYQFGFPGKEEGQLWYPRKVAVIRQSGKFVICDRGNERSRMQLFTKNGHFIKKIAIRYIDIVAGLAITGEGHIVAVDSVSPTVFVIAENGDLLRWFDCSEYMREPSDIAISGKEYYICDFKGHCVVVFNENGQQMRRIGCENITNFPNGIDISDAGDVLVGDSHGNRFHVVVFSSEGSLLSEFECPYVKVSRCCGLKITSEGYVVTLAKNNHHVLILNTLYIM